MSADAVLRAIRGRRSVRAFLPDAVPADDLRTIVDAGCWAPSGTNQQNWRFIVVTDPALKEGLRAAVTAAIDDLGMRISSPRARTEFSAYAKYYTFFAAAPAVIAVVKRPYESLARRIMERYNLGDGGVSSADIQGPAAAVQNLLLAAHALGYGACWMTGPLIARPALERILEVRAPDELLALVPVGRPAKVPAAPPRRDTADTVGWR